MDGPAIIRTGYKIGITEEEYWVDGKRHRLDGPAIEWREGSKRWWVDGQRLSEEKEKIA